MSRTFVPVSAEYALDGRWFYEKREAPGAQAGIVGPVLYAGIVPGHHVLQARIHYRGYGEGEFSYLTKYHFQVVSTHDFAVTAGALAELMAIARERPGVQIPIDERPTVHWLEGSDLVDAAAKAEHSGLAAPAAPACSPPEFGPLPPDRREQQVLGMCRKTVCPFSPHEEELLRLGETAERPDMIQKARELRRRRLDELSASCSRLRLEGKL